MAMNEPAIEVGSPSGRDLEDLSIWVAEAVDDWASEKAVADPEDAESARQLARALRVLGWMASIDQRRDLAAEESLIEALLRAFELLLPTTAPASGERRKLTPIASIALRDLRTLDEPDHDEEETVVRKALSRSTNRILG